MSTEKSLSAVTSYLMVAATAVGVAASAYTAYVAWDQRRRHRLVTIYPFLNRTDFSEEEEALLGAVVPPGSIKTKLADIGGLASVKREVSETVILPFRRPELFTTTLLSPFSGVLLYGPPGTGKTLMAKAIASECGASFINVDVSTLRSRWYGESEARVVALFSLARKIEPCIIFFDEIDALLSRRDDYLDHEISAVVKAGIMSGWQGLQSDSTARVIVVGATNRPAVIDAAVLRRLPRKFHLSLPDAEARASILQLFLRPQLGASRDTPSDAPDVNCNVVARLTEGFSGSDLENLCKLAAHIPLREYLDAERDFVAGLVARKPTSMRSITTRDVVNCIPSITTQDQNEFLGTYL